MAALGLLAKVVEGRGGQVDVAMYDVMLSQLNYLAGASLNAGEVMERLANSSHPYMVPAQIFPTSDGWLTLFITHDKFWQKFCAKIGKPEWVPPTHWPAHAAASARVEDRGTHGHGLLLAGRQPDDASRALSRAQPGDVLVVVRQAELSGAQWDDPATRCALKKGLAGVVVQGCARDVDPRRSPRRHLV